MDTAVFSINLLSVSLALPAREREYGQHSALKNNNLTILPTRGGNWTHNLQTAWCPDHLCAWDGYRCLPSAKGLPKPTPEEQLPTAAAQGFQGVCWNKQLRLEDFVIPVLSLTSDRWSSCRQLSRSRGSSPQCWAGTFCTCKAREGPCSHPGHKDTTFMTEQGHQVRNGGKKRFDTLVCNYISRSVAQEIYLNYTSHSFNIK